MLSGLFALSALEAVLVIWAIGGAAVIAYGIGRLHGVEERERGAV